MAADTAERNRSVLRLALGLAVDRLPPGMLDDLDALAARLSPTEARFVASLIRSGRVWMDWSAL